MGYDLIKITMGNESVDMKILSMTWTIYDNRISEFSKDYTGGGLMIKNICEYIGRTHESYLFIGRYKIAEQNLGNIHIIGTDIFPDTKDECSDVNENHLNTMTKAFEDAIEKISPDIVNFHGLGDLMQRCLKVCINRNVPYVYTDHLFIGSSFNIKGYNKNVKWEREVYSIPGLRIIAVSTGMKKKILKSFPHVLSENITVIKNGTDFTAEWNSGDLQKTYSLNNKKVLLCAGTVNYRKNQCQIIKAFQLLPLEIQDKLKIIFCGKDGMNGELQDCIANAGLQKRLIYVGAVSSEKMKKYYSISDGLIMPSYAEGLSIAALEALTYGLPIIMFADSECADDLNDEKIVCFAKDRSDFSLTEAIKTWYEKKWDKDYIIRYSGYFTMERVANDYINYYRRCIAEA